MATQASDSGTPIPCSPRSPAQCHLPNGARYRPGPARPAPRGRIPRSPRTRFSVPGVWAAAARRPPGGPGRPSSGSRGRCGVRHSPSGRGGGEEGRCGARPGAACCRGGSGGGGAPRRGAARCCPARPAPPTRMRQIRLPGGGARAAQRRAPSGRRRCGEEGAAGSERHPAAEGPSSFRADGAPVLGRKCPSRRRRCACGARRRHAALPVPSRPEAATAELPSRTRGVPQPPWPGCRVRSASSAASWPWWGPPSTPSTSGRCCCPRSTVSARGGAGERAGPL